MNNIQLIKKIKVMLLVVMMLTTSNAVNVITYASEKTGEEITRDKVINEQLSNELKEELMEDKDKVHEAYVDKRLMDVCNLVIRGLVQYKKAKDKEIQLTCLKNILREYVKEKYGQDIEHLDGRTSAEIFMRNVSWIDYLFNTKDEYSMKMEKYKKFIKAYNQFKRDKENLKDRIFEGITKVIDIIKHKSNSITENGGDIIIASENYQYKPIVEILKKYESSKEEMSEEDTNKIKEFFEAKIKEVSKREKRIYDKRIIGVFTEILKRRYHYMEEDTETKINTFSNLCDELIECEPKDMFDYSEIQKLSYKDTWNERNFINNNGLSGLVKKALIAGLIVTAFGFSWYAAPMMFGDMLIDVVKGMYYSDEKKYELEKMYKTDSFVDSFSSKDRYIKRRESEIQRIIIYNVWKEEILKRRKDLTDKYIEEKIKEEEEYAEKERKNTGRRGITTSDVLQMIYIHKKVTRLENNIGLEMINNIEKEIQENIDRLKETYKKVYKEGETHLLDLDYIKENLNLINLDKEFIIGGEKKIRTYKIEFDIKEWKQTYTDKEGNEIEIIEEEGKNKYYCGREEVEIDTEGNVIKRNIGTKTEEELKRAREEAKERRRKEMIDKYNYCYYKYYELDKVMKEWKEIPEEMYFPSIKEIEEKNKTKYEIKDMEECRWKTYESDVSRERRYKWYSLIYEVVKTIGMGMSLRGAPWHVWLELSPVLSSGTYNVGMDLYDHYRFSNDCYKEIDYDREGYFKNIDKEILKEEEKKLNLYRARTGKDGATREDIIELIVLKKMIQKKLENERSKGLPNLDEKCSGFALSNIEYKCGSKMPYTPNEKAGYDMLKFINKVLDEARESGKEAGIDAYNIDIEDKYIKYDSMINIPASKYIQRESQKNLVSYNKWKWSLIAIARLSKLFYTTYHRYKENNIPQPAPNQGVEANPQPQPAPNQGVEANPQPKPAPEVNKGVDLNAQPKPAPEANPLLQPAKEVNKVVEGNAIPQLANAIPQPANAIPQPAQGGNPAGEANAIPLQPAPGEPLVLPGQDLRNANIDLLITTLATTSLLGFVWGDLHTRVCEILEDKDFMNYFNSINKELEYNDKTSFKK